MVKKTFAVVMLCVLMLALFPLNSIAAKSCSSWVVTSTDNGGCYDGCGPWTPESVWRAQWWKDNKIRVCVDDNGKTFNETTSSLRTDGCC